MSDEPLAREREPIERVRARLEALIMANAACSIQADRQALPSGSESGYRGRVRGRTHRARRTENERYLVVMKPRVGTESAGVTRALA
jgi:hypothetical protein